MTLAHDRDPQVAPASGTSVPTVGDPTASALTSRAPTAHARTTGRRRVRQPNHFAAADIELADTLETLDGADRYVEWITSFLVPHVRGRVLEVGAGHGTFSERLAAVSPQLVVSEPSERAVELLQERFAGRDHVAVLAGDATAAAAEGPFDLIVLVNVLEHIDDDQQTLVVLRDGLASGGRIAVLVPAFELLYSRYDRSIGHFRRYRRPELVGLAERAGLSVLDARYVNSIGFFGWLATAKLLRARPTEPRLVQRYDRVAVPIVRALEARVRPPFGQSVLLVAERV